MSAPGSGGLRWRPVHTWLWRRPAYQVLAFTAVMAALGQMVSRLVWTPQLSGADAPITIPVSYTHLTLPTNREV